MREADLLSQLNLLPLWSPPYVQVVCSDIYCHYRAFHSWDYSGLPAVSVLRAKEDGCLPPWPPPTSVSHSAAHLQLSLFWSLWSSCNLSDTDTEGENQTKSQSNISHPFISLGFQWQPWGSADSKTILCSVLINVQLTWTCMPCTVCPVTSGTLKPVQTLLCNFRLQQSCLSLLLRNIIFCKQLHVTLHLSVSAWWARRAAAHCGARHTGLYKVLLGPFIQAPGRVTVTLSPKSLKTQQQLHSRAGINSPQFN